ncbi:hypothetical protein H0194_04745 [Corynebacterium incognita]|uniref:Uncharacterized protein n=1 Tax=Corynebacterium incognita TaxID=2754725 RepID=A0A7G7CRS2_9CORY|nr:hypothetical protein [Corynebacterium incognita]QNE90288.1 hypothetical protein H0194_04745 [Corynebacterium incognita]
MARNYGKIAYHHWTDPNFTQLTHTAQWLYLLAHTHPSITWAGVIEYRPHKLQALNTNLTAQDIQQAAQELHNHGWLLIDPDTEEALITTYYTDLVYLRQVNLGVSIARDLRLLASQKLHNHIRNQLTTIHNQHPHLAGLQNPELLAYMYPHQP